MKRLLILSDNSSFMIGVQRRIERLFHKDGRSLVVAIDHGLFFGAMSGISNFGETASRLIEGAVDAIQLSPAMARFVAEERLRSVPIIARLDTTNLWRDRPLAEKGVHELVFKPIEAALIDAQAVVVYLLLGGEYEGESIEVVSNAVRDAHILGLPVVVEPLSVKGMGEPVQNARELLNASRIAVELGADILKVDYTGDTDTFRQLIEACPVPVLLRGGPKKASEDEVLQMISDAMEAGARGIVFGRNIWQSANMQATLSKYLALVHHKKALKSS